MIGDCNSQALASTAWALAVLQVRSLDKPPPTDDDTQTEAMVAALSMPLNPASPRIATQHAVAKDMKPRDLASLVWSFASLVVEPPSLRKTIHDFVGSGAAAQLSAIDVSSIAWSEEIARASSKLMRSQDLPVQALSNLAWAFATVLIEHFGSQDLANTAWAFGVLQKSFVVKAVAAVALKRLDDLGSAAFTAQGISNIVWSLATVATLQKPLLHSFSRTFAAQLPEWKAQELSNSAWSFATLLVMDPVVDLIADCAFHQLEHFGFRHSANLAWALATLNQSHEPLLKAMAAIAAANASELSPLSLASTAWACVSMKIIHVELLDAMSKMLFQSPVDDGIATMAIWSLSRLGDLEMAFHLVASAKWRIPPLSLSALLEACEQRDDAAAQLRVLRLLAQGNLKPVVMDVVKTFGRPSHPL
eukprot:Skav219968  [mRNA]  locus=scaffold2879:364135:369448:+ [translate_table: standard]